MIFELLTFYENQTVIKTLLHQVNFEVLAKDLNFAAELVIRTLDQLEFALVFVRLHLAAESPRAAFVIALNHFVEAALVVSLCVFDHQQRHTVLVLAHNFLVAALLLVSVHIFPFEGDRAAVLK